MHQSYHHIPVLLQEVIEVLHPKSGDRILDATLGLGGHALGLLDQIGPAGRLLGIERSAEGLEQARQRLAPYASQTTLVRGNFRDLDTIAARTGFERFEGALLDLGLASWQIDQGHQGLSFQIDGPLDMRLGSITPDEALSGADDPRTWTEDATLAHTVRTWRFRSAAEFLNSAPEADIDNVLHNLGGVRQSRAVAAAIVAARTKRPIETTGDLVAAIGSESPSLLAPVFQALRVLVNDEYGALTAGLGAAWQRLVGGGKLAVITFHSLEDRLVKQVLRSLPSRSQLGRMRPTPAEIMHNPRSRSATLRYIERI